MKLLSRVHVLITCKVRAWEGIDGLERVTLRLSYCRSTVIKYISFNSKRQIQEIQISKLMWTICLLKGNLSFYLFLYYACSRYHKYLPRWEYKALSRDTTFWKRFCIILCGQLFPLKVRLLLSCINYVKLMICQKRQHFNLDFSLTLKLLLLLL